MKIAMLTLGLLAAAGAARADEEKVAPGDLPKRVMAAVKGRFPDAKVTGATKEVEGGEAVYEVSLTDDDQAVDVLLSARGKVIEVEKTIPSRKLPRTVAAAVGARFPGATIKKAERIVKREDGAKVRLFEVVVAAGGKPDVEVKLSRQGKILEEEADGEDDDAPKAGGEKPDDQEAKATPDAGEAGRPKGGA